VTAAGRGVDAGEPRREGGVEAVAHDGAAGGGGVVKGKGVRQLADVCEVAARTRHRGGGALRSARLADLELQRGRTAARQHCRMAIGSCSRGSDG
jgi:hypothetical protein